MKLKRLICLSGLLSLWLFLGALAQFKTSKTELPATTEKETLRQPKLYFSGTPETILIDLNDYADTYDITTKEGKIDYLLTRLQTTSYGVKRNGAHYTPPQAAEFLRWKMYRPRWIKKVGSARDFVDVICAGSITSGKPYTVILPSGEEINLQIIFQNEFKILDNYLNKTSKT